MDIEAKLGQEAVVGLRGPLMLAAALCILAWATLMWACSLALGAPDRPVLLATFNGSGVGVSLAQPTGLAIDQSALTLAGNVLLADGGGNNVVDLFGPEGGAPAGSVPTQVSHAFSFGQEPAGVAVDNSGDASNGDIYVADIGDGVVDKFKLIGSSYEYICQITGYGSGCDFNGGPASEAFSEPDGIAIDAHGNVYVSDYGNEVVDEFSETGADVRQITGSVIALGHPSGLAFDGQGDMYVQQYGGGSVLRFGANASGEVEPTTRPTVIDGGPAYGVAVNSHSGQVYVAHSSTVTEYGPGGAHEGEFGSGVLGVVSGVAVNTITGNVYVADSGHHDVDMFGVPPLRPPSVGSEYVRSVASSSAVLAAHVDARDFDTHCYFEYGASPSYSAGRVPGTPGIDVGSGGALEGERTAEVMLSGLTSGMTYHYRVVAINSHGETSYGPDHEFTTFTAGLPGLPDGRAYEMVSPPYKSNSDILGIDGSSGGAVVEASQDGNAITFVSHGAFNGSESNGPGNQYVADRYDEGWATHSINPPMNAQTYASAGEGVPYEAFSTDLSTGLLFGGIATEFLHGVENSSLEPNAPEGYENYYLHAVEGRDYEALLTMRPKVMPDEFGMTLVGATPDLGHLVIKSAASLTPEATEETGKKQLYEWAKGKFQLLTILPNEIPDDSTQLELGNGKPDPRDISEDGSRVFWTDKASNGNLSGSLYVREGIGSPQARTIQLDASRGGPDAGSGDFLTASADGSKVFFADTEQLTATTGNINGLGDLYEFTLESQNPEGGHLVDVGPGAELQGVLGEGESKTEGMYLYFVGNGVLAAHASPGNCAKGQIGTECNLYVLHENLTTHERTIAFIARLTEEDDSQSERDAPGVAIDWSFNFALRTARVTGDGKHLVFMSSNSLTDYDNTVAGGSDCGIDAANHPLPVQCEEVYLYDAGEAGTEGSLRCVSCNPSGERPTGPSSIPGGTDFVEKASLYQSRVISEDGSRVFFESDDGLVPQDVNGRRDVYEYEDGQPYLISSGRSEADASFVDASADGNDVFFITRAALVPQDTDQLVDLYDARAPHISGEEVGFSAQEAAIQCGSEGECRPPSLPVMSPVGAPSSAIFNGPASTVPLAPKATHIKRRVKRSVRKKKRSRHEPTKSKHGVRKRRTKTMHGGRR